MAERSWKDGSPQCQAPAQWREASLQAWESYATIGQRGKGASGQAAEAKHGISKVPLPGDPRKLGAAHRSGGPGEIGICTERTTSPSLARGRLCASS